MLPGKPCVCMDVEGALGITAGSMAYVSYIESAPKPAAGTRSARQTVALPTPSG